MRKKHKPGNIKRHKGNPHGNPPETEHFGPGQLTSEDKLRQEGGKGISQSPRLKQ